MSSTALANFFIEKAKEEKVPLSNLKLQKLMFIGYGWIAAVEGKDVTDGEGFQAWQHGPVLPSVYHQVKIYGNDSIDKLASEFDFEDDLFHYPKIKDPNQQAILSKVWDVYKKFSASNLRNISHKEGSPWHQAFDNKRNTPISFENTRNFYYEELTGLLNNAE